MRLASNFSTSRSVSVLPSMRVDDPMLSIVATRRKALKRSGSKLPSARQAPLNSSISEISARISVVILIVFYFNILVPFHPHYHPITPAAKARTSISARRVISPRTLKSEGGHDDERDISYPA